MARRNLPAVSENVSEMEEDSDSLPEGRHFLQLAQALTGKKFEHLIVGRGANGAAEAVGEVFLKTSVVDVHSPARVEVVDLDTVEVGAAATGEEGTLFKSIKIVYLAPLFESPSQPPFPLLLIDGQSPPSKSPFPDLA